MLYVCGTPIGNLGDVTPRLLETLRTVQVVACEDTRRTLKLLTHFGISGPRLVSLHEHNEEGRVAELLPLLRAGTDVALVSDAGMPVLSDPGLRLIQACRTEGIPVAVVPGPSAPVAALAVSGLPSDRVLFVGFLPRNRERLAELVAEAAAVRATLVGFESPRRVRATLEVLATLEMTAVRETGLTVAVCRELTKAHEEVVCGRPAEVAAQLSEPVRGEVVIVLRAPTARERPATSPHDADELAVVVQRLLQEGYSTKDVAELVAERVGRSRGWAYKLVLEIRRRGAVVGREESVC